MIEKNEWERRMDGRQLGNWEMSGISNNKVAEVERRLVAAVIRF